jgi:hypothetical protein
MNWSLSEKVGVVSLVLIIFLSLQVDWLPWKLVWKVDPKIFAILVLPIVMAEIGTIYLLGRKKFSRGGQDLTFLLIFFLLVIFVLPDPVFQEWPMGVRAIVSFLFWGLVLAMGLGYSMRKLIGKK